MGHVEKFRAVIEAARGGGAFVAIPFDVEAVYGKKRVKVKAMIEGIPYRGSLVRMGGDCHILGILKAIREQAGKQIGDEVEVTVEEDEEAREVSIPADLAQALLSDPQAAQIFNRLAYTHQKEYVRWVEEAKRSETRQARIEKTLGMLKEGKKER